MKNFLIYRVIFRDINRKNFKIMRRKETSLLVESWRSFINEGEDKDPNYLDGGLFEDFTESTNKTNIGKNEIKSIESSLHSQRGNDKTKPGKGSNLERSGLSLEDEKKYVVKNSGEYGKGVYYVTDTGVWCIPLIQGEGVNTRNACLDFVSYLNSKGFKKSENNPSNLSN